MFRRTSSDPDSQMSFLGHLEELRVRVMRSLIAVVVAFVICYAASRPILKFFLAPIQTNLFGGGEIVFRELTEPFLIYMKVALIAGLFLASPYLFWEVWGFVSPGLLPKERRWAIPFLVGAPALFITGGLFGYYVLLPMTSRFLLSLGEDYKAQLDLRSAFSFEAWLLLGLGVVFQVPIVVALLARAGLITAGWMARQFRIAILVIFFIAAVITPTPDIVTQSAVAVPMLLLYCIGMVIAWAIGRKRK